MCIFQGQVLSRGVAVVALFLLACTAAEEAKPQASSPGDLKAGATR